MVCRFYSPISAFIAGIDVNMIDWENTKSKTRSELFFKKKKIVFFLLEHDGAAVYCSNHQSYIDLGMFGQVWLVKTRIFFTFHWQTLPKNTVCVGKTTLKWIPFFGFFWYAAGCIYVNR